MPLLPEQLPAQLGCEVWRDVVEGLSQAVHGPLVEDRLRTEHLVRLVVWLWLCVSGVGPLRPGPEEFGGAGLDGVPGEAFQVLPLMGCS